MKQISRIKGIALCVLTTALAVSFPASAETTYLKCGNYVHTLDLTNSRFDNHPVTISATSIDWEVRGNSNGITGVTIFHIDRIAGTFTVRAYYHLPSGEDQVSPPSTDTCTASSAPPATKF